jgi:putative spermidine/putrescine transport system permease protein
VAVTTDPGPRRPGSAPAPADPLVGGGRRLRPGVGGVLRRWPVLGLVPFAVYALVFLAYPLANVVVGAFQSDSARGGLTLANLRDAFSGVYLTGFRTSIELAVITAVVPGVVGFYVAYVIETGRGTALRRVVTTASGVFANFGGVPLAFLFISAIGSSGMITTWLSDLGFDPYNHGFSLYTFTGVAIVYMYFQIPLMVLVITPALQAVRPQWREASESLGAGTWAFWRYVGGPILAPAVLGSMLLLFGFGLSAYATAEALTSGSIAITSIQIGSFLNGNVIAGQANVGKALGLGMVLVATIAMVAYILLQRRVSKWSQ